MPKLTLLDMTQNILSAINGDQVNSIGDTVESMQVAEIVKETFFDLFNDQVDPTNQGMTQLVNSGDTSTPTMLSLPDNVKNIFWFKYNWHNQNDYDFRNVGYLEPQPFVERCVQTMGQTNTAVVNGPNGVQLVVKTNQPPQYWTTFNNQDLFCDAYMSSLESTLTGTNSMAFCQFEQTWQMVDTFVPSLSTNDFPLLLAEAKSVAFINIKQEPNSKEEQKSKRLQISSQNDTWRMNQRDYYDQKTNYGRRSASPRRKTPQPVGR